MGRGPPLAFVASAPILAQGRPAREGLVLGGAFPGRSIGVILALMPSLIVVDRPGLTPRPISPRLRGQLVYFAAAAGAEGVPPLGEGEYWFRPDEVGRWVDEGVFYLVSPLDTANMTEVELSEEQEALLLWLHDEGVCHVRVAD
jgi:hypothetical protein